MFPSTLLLIGKGKIHTITKNFSNGPKPGRVMLPFSPALSLTLLLVARALPREVSASSDSYAQLQLQVLASEENALALSRKGSSNTVGRSASGQVCADSRPGGYSGYHLHSSGEGGESPIKVHSACIVDDPSGSDVAQWVGYEEASGRALPMPPPLDPATGKPAQDFPTGLQRPKAAAILEVLNGAVFDCTMGGTVFNRTLAMRLSRWYYKLPPPSKPQGLAVKDMGMPVVSLCVPYGDSFQHSALDMVPKLGMLMPFLEKHPEAKLLAGKGSRALLELIGVKNPVVFAEAKTVYTAPVVHMMHFHGATPPYIGVAPYGANAAVQDSLLPPHQVPLSGVTTILYLSRLGQGMRRVANEAALLKAIQEQLSPGVRLQKFAHESLQGDAAQFRAAKVVLGPHGGAFANLIFMTPGAHVVEFIPLKRLLRSGQNPRPCYVYLAHACRLSYWTVEPEDFDFDNARMEMRVPVGQVLRTLGHIGVLRDGAAAAAIVEEAEEEKQKGSQPTAAVMRRRRGRRQEREGTMLRRPPPGWATRMGLGNKPSTHGGGRNKAATLHELRRKISLARAGRSRGRDIQQ